MPWLSFIVHLAHVVVYNMMMCWQIFDFQVCRVLQMTIYDWDTKELWSTAYNVFCRWERIWPIFTEFDMIVVDFLPYTYHPASLCDWYLWIKMKTTSGYFHAMHMWWYAMRWSIMISRASFQCPIPLLKSPPDDSANKEYAKKSKPTTNKMAAPESELSALESRYGLHCIA